jgi:dipeptidyl aminopeptidase/acylaminoacyl peptidase
MTALLRLFLLAALSIPGTADDIRATIERAERFGRESGSLVLRDEIRPFWSADGKRFAYRVDTGIREHQFVRVDLETGAKTAAFDHQALGDALGRQLQREVNAKALPIDALDPPGDPEVVVFRAFGEGWRFDGSTGKIEKFDAPAANSTLLSPRETMEKRSGGGGQATSLTVENATHGEIELFWLANRDERRSYGKLPPGETNTLSTYAGHVWLFADSRGRPLAGTVAADGPSLARVTGRIGSRRADGRRSGGDLSPDGAWRAVIRNHNLAIEPAGGGEPAFLTSDGSEADFFRGPFIWSPDSAKLAAFREKAVATRKIHIVQSSPKDQVQPKLITHDYPKPGDEMPQPMPRLFDVVNRRAIPVDDSLFANPWDIRDESWSADSGEFRFVCNQRGHQVMRLIGLLADSGSARTILEETSGTFIDYSQKYHFRPLDKGARFLWASERSGYNHLYRFDSATGSLVNAVTEGDWNVREVLDFDEAKGALLLKAVGLPGSDPYHEHFVRVNVDGSGFTRLTDADGNHHIRHSPDRSFYLATWSRVDQPPVTELRRSTDGKKIAELERADDSLLRAKGWSRPERFVAKGRDGEADIHGIIIRPLDFDPARKYPVVEDIYAGPHDHFVPKSFITWSGSNAMAEHGFIIVKIDGMGTNWRNKAFHDVCWKNLMDSGFPDRIPWIKAAASTRPWMDLARVGIFGGSAGGQSTLAGLLNHGDFYQVGVADCGCHDNRMDKIWWNEAWMGWPVDESYARNSNVTHAAKLTGKLMLVVGELDSNVDPASTYQVVAALQKAGHSFDFVPIINAGHGAAESPYGKYRRAEFLVRQLRP